MATIKFEIVSPERQIMAAEVDQVDMPGIIGGFGVLPGHEPFVSTLRSGLITIHQGGSVKKIYVRGGFADVTPDAATVLVEKALAVEDITPEFVASEIALAQAEYDNAGSSRAKDSAATMLASVKAVLTPATTQA